VPETGMDIGWGRFQLVEDTIEPGDFAMKLR